MSVSIQSKAIAFLQMCKGIFQDPQNMEYLEKLADTNDTDGFARAYCYWRNIPAHELVAISDLLDEHFSLDSAINVLHLQTQESLDEWIVELGA